MRQYGAAGEWGYDDSQLSVPRLKPTTPTIQNANDEMSFHVRERRVSGNSCCRFDCLIEIGLPSHCRRSH